MQKINHRVSGNPTTEMSALQKYRTSPALREKQIAETDQKELIIERKKVQSKIKSIGEDE